MAGLRDSDSAVNWASDTSGLYPGLCDHFVGLAYGLPNSGYKSAKAHWAGIPESDRHAGDGNAPVGSLVFFKASQYGHVAIVTGKTKSGEPIITTTHVNGGRPTQMPLSQAKGLGYLGWSTPYFNGQTAKLSDKNLATAETTVNLNVAADTYNKGQDTLSIDDLMSMSGFTGEFLKSHPAIAKVFDQAIAEGWNDGSAVGKARFDNALRNTPWWQNNAKPARDYLVAAMQGGADFEQQRTDAAAAVQADAAKIGATLDEKALKQFTTAYLMNGWKDRPDELRKALSGEGGDKFSTDHIDYGKGGPQSIITKLRQVASDNGVPLSDEYLQGAARSVIAGLRPIEDFDAEIRGHAASRFPMFGDRVKAGETVKAIASPYIQIMGQTLEKDPASITLDDPILKQAFGKVNDKGVPVAMGLWDFEKLLRARPEFRSTKTARDAVDNKIAMIGRAMGFGG